MDGGKLLSFGMALASANDGANPLMEGLLAKVGITR